MNDSTPSSGFRIVLDVLTALLFVFILTVLTVLAAGASPFDAFYHLLKGSLGSFTKFAHVLKSWAPLTLCAFGLLYTFRIDLWNIGVEGQVMMGAVFSTLILRLAVHTGFPWFFIALSLVAGIVGGAAWGLITGFLKTKGGVNEIFAGLGMNFVAQGVILWLIFGPWKRPGIASMSGTELFPVELWLPYLTRHRLSPLSLFFAVAAGVVTVLILGYTRIGLGLKAAGKNPTAAHLYGLKPDRYMLIAMIFAGGFAGLAGSIQVSGVYHRLIPAVSSNYGYLALLVVMLSNYDVRIVPLVAFFFACLNVGSIQLPMMLKLDSSLAGVIQGIMVLSVLAVHAWRSRTRRKERKRTT